MLFNSHCIDVLEPFAYLTPACRLQSESQIPHLNLTFILTCLNHSTYGFYIQNKSKISNSNLEVFVSKFNEVGSDKWYTTVSNFDQPNLAHWYRRQGDWECIVFRDKNTGERRGWYLLNRAGITKVTFHGLNQELGIEDASTI